MKRLFLPLELSRKRDSSSTQSHLEVKKMQIGIEILNYRNSTANFMLKNQLKILDED